MHNSELSEQEQIRRNSLQELKKLGYNPYPPESFHISHKSAQVKSIFEKDEEALKDVSMAGRIMSRRIMGKASFAEIQDSEGRIQIYLNRDELCPGEDKTLYNTVFKKLLDIGDIIGIRGFIFRTQMGEISVHVKELIILSKSIRPLPIVKEADGTTNAANYVIIEYPVAFSNTAEAMHAIKFERKLELGQEGHRYYDLQRWYGSNIATELQRIMDYESTMPWANLLYPGVSIGPEDVNFPVPQRQIDVSNNILIQNR